MPSGVLHCGSPSLSPFLPLSLFSEIEAVNLKASGVRTHAVVRKI